jgi:hypothetical protein
LTIRVAGVYIIYGACAISSAPRVMQLFPQLGRAGAIFFGAHVRALNAVLEISKQHTGGQAHAEESAGSQKGQNTGAAIADERLATLEQRLQALLDSSDRDTGQVDRILEEMDQVRLQAMERQ